MFVRSSGLVFVHSWQSYKLFLQKKCDVYMTTSNIYNNNNNNAFVIALFSSQSTNFFFFCLHQNMHKHIYVTHLHLCNIIIHKLIYAIYIYDIAFMLKHIYEIFLIHIWDIFMKMYAIHFLWYMYYYILKNIVMGSKHKSKKVIGIVFFFGAVHCHDLEDWRQSTFAALFRYWMLAYVYKYLFFFL